jgi:hypothetical protein
MGVIVFEGDKPFDLTLQKLPITSSQGGNVLVILPVSDGGSPSRATEIRMILTIEQASEIAGQLPSALRMARVNQNMGYA